MSFYSSVENHKKFLELQNGDFDFDYAIKQEKEKIIEKERFEKMTYKQRKIQMCKENSILYLMEDIISSIAKKIFITKLHFFDEFDPFLDKDDKEEIIDYIILICQEKTKNKIHFTKEIKLNNEKEEYFLIWTYFPNND